MSTPQVNQGLLAIKPSPIRSFNDQISKIEGLIPLTIGEPDFPTPDFIKESAIEAIRKDLNGYTHSRGLLALRQAISEFLERHYELHYSPEEEIIVTVGATEALFASLVGLLNPGQKVIVPAPNYVIYETQVRLAGAELIRHDVSHSNFKLEAEELKAQLESHPEIKILLLNHPCNPTGVTYSREELGALANVARQYDLMIVSDEIYSELTYSDKHVSMAELAPERTILINGTSKFYAMTGWRSCFIAGPKDYLSQIFKVHQATVNTPPSVSQYGSIAAYHSGDDSIHEMREAYDQRRQFLIGRFREIGYQTLLPEGAFYLFVKVPDWFQGDDFAFCLALAQEAKVGAVPGQSFGPGGSGYFRLSYAASLEKLAEAMNRIQAFTQEKTK